MSSPVQQLQTYNEQMKSKTREVIINLTTKVAALSRTVAKFDQVHGEGLVNNTGWQEIKRNILSEDELEILINHGITNQEVADMEQIIRQVSRLVTSQANKLGAGGTTPERQCYEDDQLIRANIRLEDRQEMLTQAIEMLESNNISVSCLFTNK